MGRSILRTRSLRKMKLPLSSPRTSRLAVRVGPGDLVRQRLHLRGDGLLVEDDRLDRTASGPAQDLRRTQHRRAAPPFHGIGERGVGAADARNPDDLLVPRQDRPGLPAGSAAPAPPENTVPPAAVRCLPAASPFHPATRSEPSAARTVNQALRPVRSCCSGAAAGAQRKLQRPQSLWPDSPSSAQRRAGLGPRWRREIRSRPKASSAVHSPPSGTPVPLAAAWQGGQELGPAGRDQAGTPHAGPQPE